MATHFGGWCLGKDHRFFSPTQSDLEPRRGAEACGASDPHQVGPIPQSPVGASMLSNNPILLPPRAIGARPVLEVGARPDGFPLDLMASVLFSVCRFRQASQHQLHLDHIFELSFATITAKNIMGLVYMQPLTKINLT